MIYLITGVAGFVGGHYLEYLFAERPDAFIAGTDIEEPQLDFLKSPSRRKLKFYRGSLLDRDWVPDLIKKTRPDYIVNLASYSSVAYSWENPVTCFVNNTNIFLNLIEAARKAKLEAKILSVGSSEEYGIAEAKDLPLTEKSPLNPVNPYAVARVAEEDLSKVYSAGYGMRIIRTRSFNHIGPRQKDIFAVSSFARQVAEAAKGKRDRIVCGNLDVVRDFIDVRDVIRAYDLLLEKGALGGVYNVSSGEGHKLSEILEMLRGKAHTDVPVKTEQSLMRPVENPMVIGSSKKLQKHVGFKRKYDLSRSLDDILEYWKSKI